MNNTRRTLGPAAADEALAAPLPGLPGPRRQPDERRDLSAIEGSQFRQFGNQVRAMVGPTPGTEASSPPSRPRPDPRT
jgi:hypothetical protein